jgi:hypothetical protein|tara:strand:+ start:2891 stop:3271 length:381 start_codon:yes stop_codon:yes gene_type:complete
MKWVKRILKWDNSHQELKQALKVKKLKELIALMLKSDLELFYVPSDNQYFIIDREQLCYICISDLYAKVTNHNFLYNVSMSSNESAPILKLIEQKIKVNCDKIKKELFKNELDLLEKLKNNYGENR